MKMKVLMKRKVFKITLILVLCGVGAFLLINAFKPDKASAPEYQAVTVERGNLTIDITGVGNLALSFTEDLAFEMSGTVEEILVAEGDFVEEGQMIAKLDTSEWDSQLRALENQVIAKKRDLLQAEINLKNAEYALDKAKEETTTSIVGDVVVRESADSREIDIKELQVELAEARVKDAEQALEEAREDLEEALEKSPEITASFDGFITKVNVEGGDEVLTGMVAVELADPNKFEADILISEMDILQVKLEGEAWVQVDAMQGLSLPAKITHISPTATIQAGVVNYEVKVELQSLEAVQQEQQEAWQKAMEKIAPGELPEHLKQAIAEGKITQEQAEEIMKQMQLRQVGQQGQKPAMIPEDFQLREGLTVTVSIIVDERNDVLLVPNSAIITEGQQTYVQVLSPDGMIEQRAITTGISNWQYTEITEGLNEGEQVVVPKGTATTTSATSTTKEGEQGPPGKMMVPRMMDK